jgi:hypothetical protein
MLLIPAAFAQVYIPPAVPSEIKVPPGKVLFMRAPASGTQNYICLPSGTGVAWTLFGPQATYFFTIPAFPGLSAPIGTHYLSPNPQENNTPRPTWQQHDGTKLWAKAIASSTDPAFVHPNAIPWLLLQVVGKENKERIPFVSTATHLQRVHTSGGLKPDNGCSVASEIGKTAFVPYQATYLSYR